MTLEILCTPKFTNRESKTITSIANTLKISREEVVRMAVKRFAAKCVPTHSEAISK